MFESKTKELEKVCLTDRIKNIDKALEEKDFEELEAIELRTTKALINYLEIEKKLFTTLPHVDFLRKAINYLYSSTNYLTQ